MGVTISITTPSWMTASRRPASAKIEGLPAKDLKVRHLPPGPPEVQGHPDERHQDGQEHARLEQHADDALDLLVLPEPRRGGRALIGRAGISHARRHR